MKKEGCLVMKDTEEHPLFARQILDLNKEKEKEQKENKPEKAESPAPAAAAAAASGDMFDPLGAAAPVQAVDPLGALNSSSSSSSHGLNKSGSTSGSKVILTAARSKVEEKKAYDEREDEFLPWSAMKQSVLKEYNTDQQIAITVSFMPQQFSQADLTRDRSQQRLAELERKDDDTSKTMLSQKEYIKAIDQKHKEMQQSWEREDRVKCLKVVIQAAKLLSDTSVPGFYPSKFVLITEILDTFGVLVYNRIKEKKTIMGANGKPLPEKDVPASVIASAVEMCRNWFYKIASIRELLPRIYVELAMIRCHSILADEPCFAGIIEDLSWQIRGLADPLVQAYAYCYLTRRAHDLLPYDKEYYLRCFHDTMEYHEALGPERMEAHRKALGLDAMEYNRLFSPAIEWLLHCISHKAPQAILERTLNDYRQHSKNALFLNLIISSFPPDFVTAMAPTVTQLIREADVTLFPQHMLYRTLGANLTLGNPPPGQELVVLNDVWKVVTNIENPEHYMMIAEMFIEYTLKHCKLRDVNTLLRDVLTHATDKAEDESIQKLLVATLQKIVSGCKSFADIFSLTYFVHIIDLLNPNSLIIAAKIMLEAFMRSSEVTTDPVMIQTLFTVATALHDTINSLSLSDEVRQTSRMICAFVSKIDYDREVEKQLNFYVDCRQCFGNLDAVRERLVQCVGALAMKTLTIVKGHHTSKTAAFVRACIAYCFITIPSMDDVFCRLNSYLYIAEIALANKCVAQADAFLRAAITLLQEIPTAVGTTKLVEDQVESYVGNFLSAVIMMPGHPEIGPFYLYQGLLKVLKEYPWMKGSTARGSLYCKMLQSLAALAQPTFLYHSTSGVDANDTLYKGDPKYMPELQSTIVEVIELFVEHLQALKSEADSMPTQAALGVVMFNTIINCFTLNSQTTLLAYNLAVLTKEYAATASKPMLTNINNSIKTLAKRSGKLYQDLYKKLTE